MKKITSKNDTEIHFKDSDKYSRRDFLGSAALAVAAVQFGATDSAEAQAGDIQISKTTGVEPAVRTPLGPVKQIDAGDLNVGYVDAGPANGQVVMLLHGWPYDIHSYVDVVPLLGAKGFRLIVPYLRGYGTTRFLSNETFRNGQPAAVALDAIALMDALKIERAILEPVMDFLQK